MARSNHQFVPRMLWVFFLKKNCLKLFFLEATESLSSRADHGVDGCDTEDRVFSRIVEITCVVPKQGFLNQVVALSF